MIEDTVKIVNMGMMNDDGVMCGSTSTAASTSKESATAASTKDSAIKTTDRRRNFSSFCKQKSLSRRTLSTQSSSRSSLYSTSTCNSDKRSSETFKLQLKETMHKLNDLGRKSRMEGKKKKEEKKKKKQSSEDSNNNSNSYERMIAELEQEKAAKAKMNSEILQLRKNRRRQDPQKK